MEGQLKASLEAQNTCKTVSTVVAPPEEGVVPVAPPEEGVVPVAPPEEGVVAVTICDPVVADLKQKFTGKPNLWSSVTIKDT